MKTSFQTRIENLLNRLKGEILPLVTDSIKELETIKSELTTPTIANKEISDPTPPLLTPNIQHAPLKPIEPTKEDLEKLQASMEPVDILANIQKAENTNIVENAPFEPTKEELEKVGTPPVNTELDGLITQLEETMDKISPDLEVITASKEEIMEAIKIATTIAVVFPEIADYKNGLLYLLDRIEERETLLSTIATLEKEQAPIITPEPKQIEEKKEVVEPKQIEEKKEVVEPTPEPKKDIELSTPTIQAVGEKMNLVILDYKEYKDVDVDVLVSTLYTDSKSLAKGDISNRVQMMALVEDERNKNQLVMQRIFVVDTRKVSVGVTTNGETKGVRYVFDLITDAPSKTLTMLIEALTKKFSAYKNDEVLLLEEFKKQGKKMLWVFDRPSNEAQVTDGLKTEIMDNLDVLLAHYKQTPIEIQQTIEDHDEEGDKVEPNAVEPSVNEFGDPVTPKVEEKKEVEEAPTELVTIIKDVFNHERNVNRWETGLNLLAHMQTFRNQRKLHADLNGKDKIYQHKFSSLLKKNMPKLISYFTMNPLTKVVELKVEPTEYGTDVKSVDGVENKNNKPYTIAALIYETDVKNIEGVAEDILTRDGGGNGVIVQGSLLDDLFWSKVKFNGEEELIGNIFEESKKDKHTHSIKLNGSVVYMVEMSMKDLGSDDKDTLDAVIVATPKAEPTAEPKVEKDFSKTFMPFMPTDYPSVFIPNGLMNLPMDIINDFIAWIGRDNNSFEQHDWRSGIDFLAGHSNATMYCYKVKLNPDLAYMGDWEDSLIYYFENLAVSYDSAIASQNQQPTPSVDDEDEIPF